jgi:endonuclease-3
MKAKDIVGACRMIAENYGGVVPDNMEELLLLPGVGRKIANLMLGDLYKKPAIVADTHCIRICGRLGFYPESLKDPVKVEKTMVEFVEPQEQSDFCHRIVQFGRDTCTARSPKCSECTLSDICEKNKKDKTGK